MTFPEEKFFGASTSQIGTASLLEILWTICASLKLGDALSAWTPKLGLQLQSEVDMYIYICTDIHMYVYIYRTMSILARVISQLMIRVFAIVPSRG